METFYNITMLTKNNKTLYLSLHSGKPQWTFLIEEACCWDLENEAINFAKKWFNNFINYKVVESIVDTNNL